MMITESQKSELNNLTNSIVSSVPVLKVYLFGSFAYGEPTEDSDFDIYVIIPDNSMRPIEAMHEIRAALSNQQNRPIDLLVGTQTKFDKMKNHPTIEREVADKGVVLYDREKPIKQAGVKIGLGKDKITYPRNFGKWDNEIKDMFEGYL